MKSVKEMRRSGAPSGAPEAAPPSAAAGAPPAPAPRAPLAPAALLKLSLARSGMAPAVLAAMSRRRGVSPLPPEGDSVSAFPFVVACRLGHYHVCALLLRKATHGVPTGSRAAARASQGSPGEAEVTCYICEEKFALSSFPRHIYLCLIHHKTMQEFLSAQRQLMDVIKKIIGGANRTVKLRAAAKREIFRTQRAGFLTLRSDGRLHQAARRLGDDARREQQPAHSRAHDSDEAGKITAR